MATMIPITNCNGQVVAAARRRSIRKSMEKDQPDGVYQGGKNKRYILNYPMLGPPETVNYKMTPFCIRCGAKGKLTRHHVTPRRVVRKMPEFVQNCVMTRNFVTLCQDCHHEFNGQDDDKDVTPNTDYWHAKLVAFCKEGVRYAKCDDIKLPKDTGEDNDWLQDVPQKVLPASHLGAGVGHRADDAPGVQIRPAAVQDAAAGEAGGRPVRGERGPVGHAPPTAGREVHLPAVQPAAGHRHRADVPAAGGEGRGLCYCLVALAAARTIMEDRAMTLYEYVEKLPPTPVLVIAFVAYLWAFKFAAWAWKNKSTILYASVGLVAAAVLVSSMKALPSPDAVSSITLPAITLPDVNLGSVSGGGRATGGVVLIVLALLGVGGTIAGICDWYQHCHYHGQQTLWRWPLGVVFTFVCPVAAITSLVFACRLLNGG